MSHGLKIKFGKFLRYMAKTLDISESHYKQAEACCKALGKWLGRDFT